MKRTTKIKFSVFGVFTIAVPWICISWKRWPDCLVDFGRELYIPWQINQGKVLYKDLYHYFGPLAQYFHAFLFKYFGTSLWVLIVTNFVNLFIIAFVIYCIFDFLWGSFTAFVAICIFLGIFAFGRYSYFGNYNYICPYSHELIYGLTLSLIGLLVIGHWLKRSKLIYLAIIGLLTGLIFLTKVEIFMAFEVSFISAFILNIIYEKSSPLIIVKRLLTVVLFAVIPIGGFFFYLLRYLTLPEQLTQFLFVIKSFNMSNIAFYKGISGFDDPLKNLFLVFKSLMYYLSSILVLGTLSYLVSRIKNKRERLLLISFLGIGWILIAGRIPVTSIWLAGRGIPVVLLIFVLIKWHQFFKERSLNISKIIFEIVLSLYCLILTFKILLYVTPGHYGFVLAMPGALFLGTLLTKHIPYLCRKVFYPKIFRILAALFILGVVLVHFRYCKLNYQRINYQISQGNDSFFAQDPNVSQAPGTVNNIVRWIKENTSITDTVVVMPEGVIINYLSRRTNPIPMVSFDPGLVVLIGEDKIIDLLRKAMPDYVIFINRSMSEYGPSSFGFNYGQKIYQWVIHHYENVVLFYFEISSKPSSPMGNSNIPLALIMKKKIGLK